MSVQGAMEEKLRTAFRPDELLVTNESHLHAGHGGGFDGTGETHFRVRIVAAAFTGQSRLQRHRAVNQVLRDELNAGVHALAIEANAPGGAER